MSEESAFGSQFLDALDSASGIKNFNYAERKVLREMDRCSIFERFQLKNIPNAEELTAAEAVVFLKDRCSAGLSDEDEAAVLNSMMLTLNQVVIFSD